MVEKPDNKIKFCRTIVYSTININEDPVIADHTTNWQNSGTLNGEPVIVEDYAPNATYPEGYGSAETARSSNLPSTRVSGRMRLPVGNFLVVHEPS